jgi:hypothetical protein
MAIDYSQYRPDLSTLYGDESTGRYPGRSDSFNRNISRIRTYFKRPRNYTKRMAGLGYTLPNIGGLRLREINTPQGKRTAIMGGPGNLVYGLAGAGASKNLMIGRDASGRLALVRRGARPGTPGAPGAPTPPAPAGPQAPAPDEFTKYEKDNPWIASYLRSLKNEGAAFEQKYKEQFLPSVTSALTEFGNLGVQAADRYARAAGASVAANQAAANIAPVEAAGATGAFDPVAMAAQQAASRATGEAAAENNRMAATMAALGSASAAQGLLANIQRGYSSISAEYTRKRLDDQMKLDQWIEEQKSAALDREIQQQYNLGMLNIRGDELELDVLKEKNDVEQAKADAARQGQFTDAELSAKGFKRVPARPGAKSMAVINATGVTSVEGTRWFKPGGGGGGGGGRPATPQQQADVWKSLRDAYNGNVRDPVTNAIIGGGESGFRDQDLRNQIQSVYGFIVNQIGARVLKADRNSVISVIRTAIPKIQVRQPDGTYRQEGATQRNNLVNQVVAALRRDGVIK